MILFDLKCGQGHVFEAWFGSGEDYEAQKQRGLVSCPVCDDAQVEKAVMAPAVSAKGNSVQADNVAREKFRRLMQWQRQIEANSDNVGRRFAEEARLRHALPEKDQPARGLIGEATVADALELLEEGISVSPLPLPLRRPAQA
ncbi:MAG: DUF1178 family protein [Sphingomonadaceae bacterium]